MQLILTRPYADSQALKALLEPHGARCLISPVIQIQPQTVSLDGLHTDILLASSRHAFASLPTAPKQLTHTPLALVGQQTANAAKSKGFLGETHIAASMSELLTQLTSVAAQKGLYLRGAHITACPAESLPTWHWHEIVTYRAQEATSLSNEALDTLSQKEPAGVALYSARSAALFEALADKTNAPLTALCLSSKIASSLSTQRWQSIHVADRPNQDAMVRLCLQLSGGLL